VSLWRTGGLSGLDWFWVVLAAILDLMHADLSRTQHRQAPCYRPRP
jgi:hypothetical protein